MMPSSGSSSHQSDEYWQRNDLWPPLPLKPPYRSNHDTYKHQSASTSYLDERSYSQVLQSKNIPRSSEDQSAPPSGKRKKATSESPQSDSSYVSLPDARWFRSLQLSQFSFDERFHKKGTFERIRASDARAQVQNAPAPDHGNTYPSEFGNIEGLIFQFAWPYQHIPVFSGQHQSWHPRDCPPPGPYRAVYNDNDRTTFDLMYHDPRRPRTSSGEHEFSLGHYHPGSRH